MKPREGEVAVGTVYLAMGKRNWPDSIVSKRKLRQAEKRRAGTV